MNKLAAILILGAATIAATARGESDSKQWIVMSHPTTAAAPYTADCPTFRGAVESIEIYSTSAATGCVMVTAVDAYFGSALMLCTNADLTGYKAWQPRVFPVALTGSTSLTVTNGDSSTSEKFVVAGETLRATVSAANTSNQAFKVRVKFSK